MSLRLDRLIFLPAKYGGCLDVIPKILTMKQIIAFVIISILLTACLKSDENLGFDTFQPLVLIPNANADSNFPLTDSMFSSTNTTTLLKLYAEVSWDRTLDKDVKITFTLAPELISAYNSKWSRWGLNYQPLPEDCYSIESLQLTIPSGAQKAFVPIQIHPNRIPAGTMYMLAFSVADAESLPVAVNLRNMLFTMRIL